MAMFGRETNGSGEPETTIGPSVKVEGNFTGSGDVVIEGALTGTLKTTKSVRIGSNAKVKADIDAASVFVAGEVRGNVRSTGPAELTATARIHGNLEATQLRVESGAQLNGKVSMNASASEVSASTERKPKRDPAAA